VSAHDHVFTLGIEEEFQIIDPETRELRSHIQQILADGRMILQERVKPELHQSMVELGTEICSDARDARQQVVSLRTELAKLAAQHGLKIASAGTRVPHLRRATATTRAVPPRRANSRLRRRQSLPRFNSSNQAATNFVNTKAEFTPTSQTGGDDEALLRATCSE
jgi:hypothetical protein